uniref:PHD-type domain-containing protein n=1 Tax=Strix occidentalis caurina TaxID=311401 RepID=A0A8D0FSV3_STROC
MGPSAVAGGGSACDAPSSTRPPALLLSPSGTDQAPGDNPSGTLPPALQRCSFPPAFALSPPACTLCGWAVADLDLCGQKIEREKFCAHLFCLVSVPRLSPACRQALPATLSSSECFVCGKNGAAITCCQEGCNRSFHLPCAMEGECVTQYFSPHSSFCREHRPEQKVEDSAILTSPIPSLFPPAPSAGSTAQSRRWSAWFHRGCIQARYAGISFSCPLCRNDHKFLHDMLTMGIRIPLRPWELLLCSSCAAAGTHRRCSNLRTSRTSWECESCAGQGTGKRQNTFMPLGWGQGPGKAWQQVPRLGLAEPLCSRTVRGTALASPQWPLCP